MSLEGMEPTKPHRLGIQYELATLRNELHAMARATVRYDEAIRACAADPARLRAYQSAEDEALGELYLDLLHQAQLVLGGPLGIPASGPLL